MEEERHEQNEFRLPAAIQQGNAIGIDVRWSAPALFAVES
jgi:hypothetical protein